MDCLEVTKSGAPSHDGDQPCAFAGCEDDGLWCIYVGATPSSPHACLCDEDEDHGYFCGYHQRQHAADQHSSSRPDIFPACGGVTANAALADITLLSAMGTPERRFDVDLQVLDVLVEAPNRFLNLSDPGTRLLEQKLRTIEHDRTKDYGREDIAAVLPYQGEGSTSFLHFKPDFWMGGTLDKVASLAYVHLRRALAAGYSPGQEDVPFERSLDGTWESTDRAIDRYVESVMKGATQLRSRIESQPNELTQLFELLAGFRDASPKIASWLKAAVALPPSKPEEFAAALVDGFEPAWVT